MNVQYSQKVKQHCFHSITQDQCYFRREKERDILRDYANKLITISERKIKTNSGYHFTNVADYLRNLIIFLASLSKQKEVKISKLT